MAKTLAVAAEMATAVVMVTATDHQAICLDDTWQTAVATHAGFENK
jgi:hypothetical protein